MKSFYLLLCGLGMVLLAACSSSGGTAGVGSSFDYAGAMYAESDLTTVADTGRVQFLNSYADW